jgi:phage RecT family recombinase
MNKAEELQVAKKNTTVKQIDRAKTDFINMFNKEGEQIFEREKKYAIMSIAKNPDIMNCDPNSIYLAVAQVAMAGMTLDPIKGLAHLVPRKGKCTLVIDYKGFIDLLYKELGIIISTGLVYEGDEGAMDFKEGDNGYVKAKRRFNRPEKEKPMYGYSVASFPDKRTHAFIMDWNQIMKRKKKASTTAIWDAWEEDMAMKTVIRGHWKFLPKTEKTSAAMEVMEKELAVDISNSDDSLLPDGMTFEEEKVEQEQHPTEHKEEQSETVHQAVVIDQQPKKKAGGLDPNAV